MSRMEQKFERDERPLQTLGLQPNHYALFLGRFSPEKNCHLLIEAFEQVDTSMKLVLAGGSSHTDEYVSSLRMHESARIRFLPWLSGRVLEEVLVNAAMGKRYRRDDSCVRIYGGPSATNASGRSKGPRESCVKYQTCPLSDRNVRPTQSFRKATRVTLAPASP